MNYRQQLARQLFISFNIDPAKEIKPIQTVSYFVFPRELIIEDRKKAIIEAKFGKTYSRFDIMALSLRKMVPK